MPHRYRKKSKTWGYVLALCILAIPSFVIYLSEPRSSTEEVSLRLDYPEIAGRGIIRAATEYNSISFFVDGDTLAGFNYELLHAFARDHGLRIEISPEMSHEKSLEGLASGKYDLLANTITATTVMKDSLLMTTPIILNRLVLVQRRPASDNDTTYIRSQLNLAGKTIHVPKGSPSILRIHNLGREIGDTIYVEEVELYGPEQLVALVAHGDIDYTVCDESLAETLAVDMPQVDNSIPIGFSQLHSWAVGKHSPILLDTLDTWLEAFRQTKEYNTIYRKYYGRYQ